MDVILRRPTDRGKGSSTFLREVRARSAPDLGWPPGSGSPRSSHLLAQELVGDRLAGPELAADLAHAVEVEVELLVHLGGRMIFWSAYRTLVSRAVGVVDSVADEVEVLVERRRDRSKSPYPK